MFSRLYKLQCLKNELLTFILALLVVLATLNGMEISMTLLELAYDLGLNLRKTSNNRGGEYHSACPACGNGTDRFVVWPQFNRYWCRRCEISGDGIQFCREFMKMSFREACERMNDSIRFVDKRDHHHFQQRLAVAIDPPKIWQDKALAFVEWSHKQLLQSSISLEELYQRGLNKNTISMFKLGYCSNPSNPCKDLFRDMEDWGLSRQYKDDGKLKKLWLPSGLIIPTITSSGSVLKLKVRRDRWHKEDTLPKYVEISGSIKCPSIYGDPNHKVGVVLESEIDAMLVQQEAKDICFCMALGGVTKKPDFVTDHLLREAKLILWSLDNDDADRNAALWWRITYAHLRFWPAPVGKSPGDAFKDHAIDLRRWIELGIAEARLLK